MNCTHIISGDLWAGKEAQMLLQLVELSKYNIDVSVILFNHGETSKRYINAGINCIVIDENLGFANLIKESSKIINIRTSVFSHGHKEFALALFLKFLNKAKIYTTFHGKVERHKSWFKNLKSNFVFQIYKLLANFLCEKIICVSDELKKSLNLENALVIRNCVELPKVSQKKQDINLKPIIFMAGRLVPIKRYDLAIKAIKELDVELQIAGDGILRAELENQPKTKLLGFRNDIPDLLTQADIFLICSDSEGIPTILLEAIANGINCIATSVGGIPEVVNLFPEGTCVLVKPNNSDAIKNAIQKVLANKNKTNLEAVHAIISESFSAKSAALKLKELVV